MLNEEWKKINDFDFCIFVAICLHCSLAQRISCRTRHAFWMGLKWSSRKITRNNHANPTSICFCTYFIIHVSVKFSTNEPLWNSIRVSKDLPFFSTIIICRMRRHMHFLCIKMHSPFFSFRRNICETGTRSTIDWPILNAQQHS